MSVQAAPYYWLSCDGCGTSSTANDDFAAYDSPDTAIDRAEALDWRLDAGGKQFCPSCARAEVPA